MQWINPLGFHACGSPIWRRQVDARSVTITAHKTIHSLIADKTATKSSLLPLPETTYNKYQSRHENGGHRGQRRGGQDGTAEKARCIAITQIQGQQKESATAKRRTHSCSYLPRRHAPIAKR
jgi:hypothetical protein